MINTVTKNKELFEQRVREIIKEELAKADIIDLISNNQVKWIRTMPLEEYKRRSEEDEKEYLRLKALRS